jgi:hypothetical protein
LCGGLRPLILENKISFNQAWRDFLLIRPFTRSAQITISRNTETVVVGVQTGEFKVLVKGAEQYMIDDVSCSGIILAYPRKIVEDAIKEKIFNKLIGSLFRMKKWRQSRISSIGMRKKQLHA